MGARESLELRRGVHMVNKRFCVVAVWGALVVLAVVGCRPINQLQGPVAIRQGADGLEVAVCRDISVTSVWGNLLADEWVGGANDVVFWSAEGGVSLSRGEIISATAIRAAFDEVTLADEPVLPDRFGIEIVLRSAEGLSDNIVGAFSTTPAQLDSGTWLHPDGSETIAPCT